MTVQQIHIQQYQTKNIEVANKAENGTSVESPKNADIKPDAKQMITMI